MTAHQSAGEAEAVDATTPAAPASRLGARVNFNAVLAVVAVAQFMVVLDATVVKRDVR